MGETARSRGFYKSGGEYGFKLLSERHIAILWIPEGAWVHVEAPELRFGPECVILPNRWLDKQRWKHRASEARVVKILKIENVILDNQLRLRFEWHEVDQHHSMYDHKFVYRVGDTVKPKLPYSSKDESCASGVHYFTTMTKLLLFAGSHSYSGFNIFGQAGRSCYLYHRCLGDFKSANQSLQFMRDVIEIIQADMEVLKSSGATEIDGIDVFDYFPDSSFVR